MIIEYLSNHWVDLIGYTASVFVAASFYMKTIIPLRIFAILANVFFASYGYLAGLYPVLILHIFLFPLNILRLRQMQQLIADVKGAIEDDGAVEPLLPYMTRAMYDEGELLFKKGDPADKIYYIGNGSIRLLDLDIVVGENQILGEMGIFSPYKQRTDTAICNTKMEVFAIDEDKINQLYYQNPSFGFYLIKLLTKRFILNAEMLNKKMISQSHAQEKESD
ncbi:cyclic nucleotide-binding domain-containing protein [bacterium]|nr:cyclic nucleotide-binding domain-containing protein [bacterium]